jgi:glycosyltransferase involved in cell wall biosynthesis
VRVLLIVDCYFPEQKSSAILMHELADELASRGHVVTLLAPSSDLNAPCTVQQTTPFKVIRYRTGCTKGARLYVRAVNEMLLSATAWWRAGTVIEQRHYDLAIFYSPSIFFGPLIALLKRRRHLRTYLVLRDIFPDWAVQTGVLRKGLAYRVFKVFERLQYAVADRIGVETTGSVEHFRNSAHLGKVELLRNWARTDPIRSPADRSLRRNLGLENKTVFLYGGNIGVAQDMDNIVRLARRMEEMPDAHFLLIGAGSEVERLKALVAAGKAKNITILPPVDQENYLSVISQFDVGLISLDRRLRSFSTTGKLLGYLRCGLPVLASVNAGNDLMGLLEGSGAGLCSLNGDDETFYQNAVRLCSASVRRAIADRSRALLEAEFSVQTAADRILRIGHALESGARDRRNSLQETPCSPC